MRLWTDRDIEEGAPLPNTCSLIVDAISGGLEDRGGGARLVQLGAADGEDDVHRHETVIELAPGVLLPAEHGLLDWRDGCDEGETDADGMVRLTLEGVDACTPRVELLSDILHDVRVHTRRILGRWHAEGLRVRLVDVRLAPYDHWRGEERPTVQVRLEGLDDALLPGVEVVPVEADADLDDELGRARDKLCAQFERRAQLDLLGASGTIDQMALNAIAHFGDTAETLRVLATDRRAWLPDGTALLNRCGHVHAVSGATDTAVQFGQSGISISSTFVPTEQLKDVVGRPASDVVDHAFLSPDILVRQASCSFDGGMPSLEFALDMPRKAFCAITGRVWDIGDRPDAERVDGTEIPYRARGR